MSDTTLRQVLVQPTFGAKMRDVYFPHADHVFGATIYNGKTYHAGVRYNNDHVLTSDDLLTAFEAGRARARMEADYARDGKWWHKFWQSFRAGFSRK